MSIKLRKNSEYLANVQFPDAPRGYDTLEVDAVYDQIIKDYETVHSGQPHPYKVY